MPDVVTENRLVSKQTLTRVSSAANIVAAASATAAAIALTNPDPIISKGLAIRFGIMSGVLWTISAVANDFALDPPRDDFDEVSESTASFNEDLVTDEEPLASLHRFAGRGLVLADALTTLVRSLERYDGATAAEDSDAAATQVAAIQTDAVSAADQLEFLQQFAPQVNTAWDGLLADPPVDWSSVTVEQAHEAFAEAWGDPPDTPSEPMQEFLASVDGLAAETLPPSGQHPLLENGEVPEQPDALLAEEFIQDLSEASTLLRQLVA